MSELITHGWFLPVPSDTCTDVGAVLSSLAGDRNPRIDVLIGPEDAGKSALLRRLALEYRGLGDVVRLLDLSLVDWRQGILDEGGTDVVFLDHIDRISDPEHLRIAYGILDRGIPVLGARGLSRVVIAVDGTWRNTFRAVYRVEPEKILLNAVGGWSFSVHVIRPYTDPELARCCDRLGLDVDLFRESSLRRAGVLSLAAVAQGDGTSLTGDHLREVLVRRWMESANSSCSSRIRQFLWRAMGHLSISEDSFSFSLLDLSEISHYDFSPARLRAQVGGPLRSEGGHVEWISPAWGDVSRAHALRAVIRDPEADLLEHPVRSSVLQVLLGLVDRRELLQETHRKMRLLRGPAPTGSYLCAALGSLVACADDDPCLVLEDLQLHGPDHSELRSVPEEVVQTVQDVLVDVMTPAVDDLLGFLRSRVPGSPSAFRGGHRCWTTAREWAGHLPLRPMCETALYEVAEDGEWRYEDVLDVAVTGATTTVMDRRGRDLLSVLDASPYRSTEYLADVWDGINDGAWDQVNTTAQGYLGSLCLPEEMPRSVRAVRCGLQRARMGSQDVRNWQFLECDLLLSDFRSCRNVERADLSGSNWWSAILPPAARYAMSTSCDRQEYLDWCASPPWTNPYHTAGWPVPFV